MISLFHSLAILFVPILEMHNITSTDRTSSVFLSKLRIKLPSFYPECRSLIGYVTHYLFSDTALIRYRFPPFAAC